MKKFCFCLLALMMLASCDGNSRIISFCKSQKPEVVEYLKKRVAAYTIRQFFFDEGYIEPGEQYLQLRYLPEKINPKLIE